MFIYTKGDSSEFPIFPSVIDIHDNVNDFMLVIKSGGAYYLCEHDIVDRPQKIRVISDDHSYRHTGNKHLISIWDDSVLNRDIGRWTVIARRFKVDKVGQDIYVSTECDKFYCIILSDVFEIDKQCYLEMCRDILPS